MEKVTVGKEKAPAPKSEGRNREQSGGQPCKNNNVSSPEKQVTLAGISQEMATRAGLKNVDAVKASMHTGKAVPGMLIPYHKLDGTPVLDAGADFFRLRLDKPCSDQKYHQKAGSTCHVYVPPGLDKVVGDATTLTIVEGEKKALSLIDHDVPAVGLNGFNGAMLDRKLHPEMAEILDAAPNLETIEFLGDTDTRTNKNFSLAAAKLVELVGNRYTISLPMLDFEGEKGIDDCFAVWNGDGSSQWQGLERLSLDPETHAGKEGAAAVCHELLETISNEQLEGILKGAAKGRNRLFSILASMDGLSFEQNVHIDKIVDLKIPGYKKFNINQLLKRARAGNRAENHKTEADRLTEVVKKTILVGNYYWFPRGEGDGPDHLKDFADEELLGYNRFSREDFKTYLQTDHGISPEKNDELGGTSEIKWVLKEITMKMACDHFGKAPGYPDGMHRQGATKFFVVGGSRFDPGQPNEVPAGKTAAEHYLTLEYIERLCGKGVEGEENHWEVQRDVVLALIKRARQMCANHKECLTVPPVLMIGAKGCGKTFFQTDILPPLIDRQTPVVATLRSILGQFNGDTLDSVLTLISDAWQGETSDHQSRKSLRGFYKDSAANHLGRIEKKGRDAVSISVKKWVVASANNENEDDLAAIPPTAGIEDKVVYLGCFPVKMWNRDADLNGPKMKQRMKDEASAFGWWINNLWEAPEEWKEGRFGIQIDGEPDRLWQHPLVMDAADESSPQRMLLDDLADMVALGRETATALLKEQGLRVKELWGILEEYRKSKMPDAMKDEIRLSYLLRDARKLPPRREADHVTVERKMIKGYTHWVIELHEAAGDGEA
jgi:hypothetical protein